MLDVVYLVLTYFSRINMNNTDTVHLVIRAIETAFKVKGQAFTKEEREEWFSLLFKELGLSNDEIQKLMHE